MIECNALSPTKGCRFQMETNKKTSTIWGQRISFQTPGQVKGRKWLLDTFSAESSRKKTSQSSIPKSSRTSTHLWSHMWWCPHLHWYHMSPLRFSQLPLHDGLFANSFHSVPNQHLSCNRMNFNNFSLKVNPIKKGVEFWMPPFKRPHKICSYIFEI